MPLAVTDVTNSRREILIVLRLSPPEPELWTRYQNPPLTAPFVAAALTWGREHYCTGLGAGKSASVFAPGPDVINVGHWWEPNGTCGGSVGVLLLGSRDNGAARIPAHQLEVHQIVVAEERAPTDRSAMMRVDDSSMSSGVVVNEIVSISISRSLIASGPKNCASTLNRMLFWRAT